MKGASGGCYNLNMDHKKDKIKIEEYKKNPMANLADSINRSMIGEPGELTRGGCLTRIATAVALFAIMIILYLWQKG